MGDGTLTLLLSVWMVIACLLVRLSQSNVNPLVQEIVPYSEVYSYILKWYLDHQKPHICYKKQ